MSFPLRPHHGLCLMYFTGKGYSESFTANLSSIAQTLYENPKTEVQLVCHCDQVCLPCPSCQNKVCTEEKKVLSYDQHILRLCGLTAGDRLSFLDFQERIQRFILTPGLRESVCRDCCWNSLCSGISPKLAQKG